VAKEFLRVLFLGMPDNKVDNAKKFYSLLQEKEVGGVHFWMVHGVIDVGLKNNNWNDIKECLREVTGFVVVGPKCDNCSSDKNWHLTVHVVLRGGRVWRCLNKGCGEEHDYEQSAFHSFMDFKDGRNLVEQKAIGGTVGFLKSLPPYNFPFQASAAELSNSRWKGTSIKSDNFMIQAEAAKKCADIMKEHLGEAFKEPYKTTKPEESRDKDFEHLLLASDRAFRFYAGVNFQDHSIAEQREHLEVIRGLMKVLEPLVKHSRGQTCLTSTSLEPGQTTTSGNVKT
jgi:hypothetical protein